MYIITLTENGYISVTDVENYRVSARGGSGVIGMKTSERNGKVVTTLCVDLLDDNILIATQNGIQILTPLTHIRPTGRNTQGILGIRLHKGDKVVSACIAPSK